MLRKLAISLAVAGVLSAAEAQALGLGDITIRSALNEPLEAEIRLVQTRGLSPLQIQPRMADVDEFALAGISKSRFLSDVKFTVDLTPNGEGIIRMHSSVPVKEPFLNFLVEINWPNGRLVREYTVLLDPPVFDPTPARQAAQPVLPVAGSRPAGELPSLRRPAAAAPVDNIRTRMQPASQIYVDVKDTLWALALKHRPSKQITAQQMMVALQKKNPDAFHRNNVNLLKAGVVMVLPSEAEILALTPQQAVAEIARQTEAWKQGRGKSVKKKAPVDVSRKGNGDSGGAGGQAEQGQLKIVAPANAAADSQPADGQVSNQDGGDQVKALTERNQELEQQLAATLEDVDRIERDNSEMNARLDAVQQQLDTLQRLLELKDQQVAQLQAELAAARAQIPPDPVPAAESPGLIDKLLSSPLYWGSALGGLLAALGGALFALFRRGRNEGSGEQAAEQGGKPLVQVPEELNVGEDQPAEEAAEEEAKPADERDVAEESDEALDAVEDLDDLSDLDLDLDMDLELDPMDDELMDGVESTEEAAQAEEVAPPAEDHLDDVEFDLGIEDDLEELDLQQGAAEQDDVEAEADAAESTDDQVPLDNELDSILSEEAQDAEADDDLDSLLNEVQSAAEADSDELDADLDASLDELLTEGAVEESQRLDEVPLEEAGLEIDIADDDEPDTDDDLLDGLDLDELLAENGLESDAPDGQPQREIEPVDAADAPAEAEAAEEAASAEDAALELAEADSLFDEILQQDGAEEPSAATVDSATPFELELEEDAESGGDSPVSDDELDALFEMADQPSVGEEKQPAEPSTDLAGDELDALFESASGGAADEAADEAQTEGAEELTADELDALFDEVSEPVAETEAGAEPEEGLNLHPDLAELLAEQPASSPADEDDELALDVDLPLAEAPEAPAAETEAEEADFAEVELSGGLDDMLAELDQADDDEPKEATAEDLAEVELQEEDLVGDLDDMLAELGEQVASKGGDDLASLERSQKAADVEAELTASIAHDLEAELDDELDALLNGTDREIALDESDALEELPGLDDDLNLLAGADEVETKLDLAKAYIEMGDQEGARDILNEVKAEGSDTQQKEADKLLADLTTA